LKLDVHSNVEPLRKEPFMDRRAVCGGVLLLLACGSSQNVAIDDAGAERDTSSRGDDALAGDAANTMPDATSADDHERSDAGTIGDDGRSITPDGTPFDGTAADVGGGPFVGKIVFEVLDEGPYSYTYVVAGFAPEGGSYPVLGCPRDSLASGPCCYISPAVAAATAGSVSAGTLVIDRGLLALDQIPFGPQGYDTWISSAAWWGPGEQLGIEALGGAVQRFSASVTAPEPPYGVVPASGSTVTLSVSADQPVKWTAGAVAGVKVIASVATSAHGLIKCIVDDTSGAAIVPASLLGQLPSTETGTLSVVRTEVRTWKTPNATVEMAAFAAVGATVHLAP
jgi:hypothetical protein